MRMPPPSIALLLAGLLSAGCASRSDARLGQLVAEGEYGQARVHVLRWLSDNEKSRDFLVDRMRLGVVSLADGELGTGKRAFEEVYDKLRTQGINDDKTLAIFLGSDRATFWKGEPFEQALAYHYVGVWNALRGDWDNTRAAAGDSLFHLKDFGTDEEGRRLDTEDLVRNDAAWDEEDRGDYITEGYTPVESNFALGYLMRGIANLQYAERAEAGEMLAAAVRIDPSLGSIAERLETGRYNALLLVDYGLGPEKYARGRDNAIADFRPLTPSDDRPLLVTVDGRTERFPLACDVNAMAADHMWKGVEDVRIAKSTIGTALLTGGAVTASYGSSRDDNGAMYAGLALMLVGAIQKASARADTTYCEVMPQRTYVAPITLPADGGTVEIQVEGEPGSFLVLHDLRPARNRTAVAYARLIDGAYAPAWAQSREIMYCNDVAPALDGLHVPFIVGGDCVCTPTEAMMRSCHEHGLFSDMTADDLAHVYEMEGIRIAGRTPGPPGLHVLEGGDWLYTPAAGSAGYARLYGRPAARAWVPRSEEGRALAARLTAQGVFAAR